MRREEIAPAWDRLAGAYDRMERPVDALVAARWRRALLRLARGRTLEIAAGTGRNLAFYPPGPDLSLTLADLSAGMLALARRRAQGDRRVRAMLRCDAERLPFAGASFDTVVETLSLCIVPNPAAALREMARVCRPDGRILLLEHVRSSAAPLGWLQDRLTPLQEARVGCHLNRDALAAIKEAGLRLRSVDAHYLGVMLVAVAQPPAAVRPPEGA